MRLERPWWPIEAPQPTTTLPPPQSFQDYAGDLHRLVAEKLAQEYPNERLDRRYLIETAALLLAKSALHPSDMPNMTKVIETATEDHTSSLEMLVQGLIKLNAIHKEVRLSADSSPLAKTITGIACDSAEKAVGTVTNAPPSDPQPSLKAY
jgi:hypothetical protein